MQRSVVRVMIMLKYGVRVQVVCQTSHLMSYSNHRTLHNVGFLTNRAASCAKQDRQQGKSREGSSGPRL